jgi:hypothetical protein
MARSGAEVPGLSPIRRDYSLPGSALHSRCQGACSCRRTAVWVWRVSSGAVRTGMRPGSSCGRGCAGYRGCFQKIGLAVVPRRRGFRSFSSKSDVGCVVRECCAYPRMGAALLHLMRDGAVFGAAWSCVRAAAADLERVKGVRWMPWRQEAMKDVARCDKPRGDASDR